MKLSIVATLYKSAPYIIEFCRRASSSASALVGEDYEIVLVNDGSPDDSLDIAVELTKSDAHLVVVDLSRNFGHHKAMMTGLAHAKGEFIFLIDSDLEEEPEWLLSFSNQMLTDQCDVVYGIQRERRGGIVERYSGYLFYKLFRFLTGINQPDNIVTARLMSRRYIEALLAYPEREFNIGGLWISAGFKQVSQYVVKHATSPTTYNLRNKIGHFVNAVVSFSQKPLELVFYSGAIILLSSLVFILKLVVQYFFVDETPQGYLSVIASIWFFSGLIVFFLGILGIYISKIFLEVKGRPLVIVKNIYSLASKKDRNNG